MKHFFPSAPLWALALGALLSATLCLNAQDLPKDNNGWSQISRSSDSRVIYCSHSTGNDSNNGLSSGSPVKSLNKAFSLVRNGYPDHVYLRRGDTWTNQTFQGLKSKSGRSSTQRIIVAYYGSGNRPQIKTDNDFILPITSGSVQNLAIIGIEFYNYTVNPNDPNYAYPGEGKVKDGFHFQGSRVYNFLLEDCKISYFKNLVTIFNKDYGSGDAFINIDIRRNILVNAYNPGSTYKKIKSQGIYVSHTKDLLIEENFMDRNGWYQGRDDSQASQYTHNIYLSSDNAGPCIVSGNIISQGAAHGLQLRSGGTAENNAFIGNAIGMNIGYTAKPTYYSGSTVVHNNVVTDGRPQVPNDNTLPQTGAIWGIWKQKIDKVTVSHNIVANIQDTRGGKMNPYNEGLQNDPNAFGTGNIGWNWNQENFPATDPGWADPTRDKESFAAAKGYPNYEAWVKAASNRGIKNFPAKFTAYDYVDYIRAGFGKPAVKRLYGGDGGDGSDGGSTAPLMHWKFNGNGADATNQNYAKLQGGAGFTTTSREGSQALLTDGIDDWADIDNAALETSFNKRTVAFWVDFDTRSGTSTVYEEGGSTNGFGIRCQNEVLQARARSGSNSVNVAMPYTYTGWQYITLVFDQGNLKLYRNGNLMDETNSSLSEVPNHSDPAGIAQTNGNDVWNAGSDHYFHGRLDDFRIYKAALAQSEIQALYSRNARVAPVQTKVATEPAWAEKIVIYPNPAQNVLRVRLPNREGEVTITLLDILGREVLQYHQLNANEISLPVQVLPRGLYQVSIQQSGQQTLRKLLIE